METRNLFIQQPFATMLVRGLRNGVFDDQFSKGCRLYINALPCFMMSDVPLEWFQAVNNHQLFGNLPPTADLPTGKCVGFVDVLDKADGTECQWTAIHEPTVLLTNAHEFDTPLGKELRSWYDADNIPSHVFRFNLPYALYHDDELVIPVNEKLYRFASRGGNITFELTGSLAGCALENDGLLRDFERFTVICGQQSKSFLWNKGCDILWEQRPNDDELVLYPSVFNKSGKAPRAKLLLTCNYPLNS